VAVSLVYVLKLAQKVVMLILQYGLPEARIVVGRLAFFNTFTGILLLCKRFFYERQQVYKRGVSKNIKVSSNSSIKSEICTLCTVWYCVVITVTSLTTVLQHYKLTTANNLSSAY
jgi:hypothetical protein